MQVIIKVALGVFFGLFLWERKDSIGWFVLAGIVLVVFGWLLIYIIKSALNYLDEFGLKRDCINLAKELELLGFCDGIGIQSLALIFQRCEHRWEIHRLMADVDKFKIRKSNGYEASDERENIERSFKEIVKYVKDNSWSAI